MNYKEYLKLPIRNDRKPLHELLPLKQPLRVLIDPCDICNFRCNFCFQSKQKFKGNKMTNQVFDIIVKQLMEFEQPINVVHLFGLGEPLINENIANFVATLKENNVAKEVAITSNGSLLNKELSQMLIAAGLDRLSISLNGMNDEDFKKIVGVNVNFNKMYEQIKYFYDIRESCHLHVKINGDYFSEEEKERFVYLFNDCTDSINIDHIVNVWPGLNVTEKNNYRMYDFDIEGLKNADKSRRPVCPLMFYELLIHSDGTVSPCAVDYSYKEENLGSVLHETLKEIWEGNQLLKMRRQALRGKKISYSICKDCQYTECAATVNITSFRDELLERY